MDIPRHTSTYFIVRHGAEIRSSTDQIQAYLYPYLFYPMNINTDMDIIRMQKIIFIFILNKYGYNLDIESMDIITDIT